MSERAAAFAAMNLGLKLYEGRGNVLGRQLYDKRWGGIKLSPGPGEGNKKDDEEEKDDEEDPKRTLMVKKKGSKAAVQINKGAGRRREKT